MAVDEVVLPVEEIQISDGLPHRVRAQAGAQDGALLQNSPPPDTGEAAVGGGVRGIKYCEFG